MGLISVHPPERAFVHIDYHVSQQDYISGAMLALRRGSTSSRIRYYYFCGFIVLWFAMDLLGARAGGQWHLDQIWSGLIILPFIAFFLWIQRFRFDREFRKNATLHGIQQLDVNESGVRLVTGESETRSTWKTYSRYAENSRVFILFHAGDKTFIPISKSAMNTEQAAELRGLFKANLHR